MIGDLHRLLVTGPHRAGTTIATEIIASDWGLHPIRESEIAHPRFNGDDEPDLSKEDVIRLCQERSGFVLQGATTFRWLNEVAPYFDMIVCVKRNVEDIRRSQMAYRGRYLDDPDFKYAELAMMNLPVPVLWVSYEKLLSRHPLFVADRAGWAPRQTSH